MAITIDATLDTPTSNMDLVSFNFTVGNFSNRLLIVTIHCAGNSQPSAVSYGGVAMSLVDEVTSGTGSTNRRTQMWYLVAPATGSNAIDVTGGGPGGIVCRSYYGVDQSTPLGTIAKTAATSGTSNSVSPSSATNDLVIDAETNRSTSAPTRTASQNADTSNVTNTNIAYDTSNLAASSPTTTMSYSFGNDNNSLLAIAIKPAAAASAVGPLIGGKLTKSILLRGGRLVP